jgi:hypothetical protein
VNTRTSPSTTHRAAPSASPSAHHRDRPIHTVHPTYTTHPVHPSHPAHTYTTRPTRPSSPVHPTHPAHPAAPVRTGPRPGDGRRRRTATRSAGLAVLAALTVASCGSDDDGGSAAQLSTEACDAYAAIGAAMFGDPSTIPDSIDALHAAAPGELHEAIGTYGEAMQASFDGDEEAMSSPEFVAADREIGSAVFESCETAATLDVSGIDFAFEGIPDEVDAGRVAIRFTNDTEQAEAHEMFVMQRADGVDEPVTELMELPHEELFGKVIPTAVAYADEAGGVNVALVDLAPGEYIAICMIPTTTDGAPHATHGMVDEFTVT